MDDDKNYEGLTGHYNPVKTLRVPVELLSQIETENFSKWVIEAMKGRIEAEKGLTPEYEKRLAFLLRELVSIGRNLNQLARAANSGKAVTMSDDLIAALEEKIKSLKTEILEVKARL